MSFQKEGNGFIHVQRDSDDSDTDEDIKDSCASQ